MRPEIHEDGTVTCWRVETREYARTHPREISVDSFARISVADRERLAARFEILRSLTTERTMVRVRIDFVVPLPLGSEIPDPQIEAVSSAALAIFGPSEISPDPRISVKKTRRRSTR
jgi:hypothetical protein